MTEHTHIEQRRWYLKKEGEEEEKEDKEEMKKEKGKAKMKRKKGGGGGEGRGGREEEINISLWAKVRQAYCPLWMISSLQAQDFFSATHPTVCFGTLSSFRITLGELGLGEPA